MKTYVNCAVGESFSLGLRMMFDHNVFGWFHISCENTCSNVFWLVFCESEFPIRRDLTDFFVYVDFSLFYF